MRLGVRTMGAAVVAAWLMVAGCGGEGGEADRSAEAARSTASVAPEIPAPAGDASQVRLPAPGSLDPERVLAMPGPAEGGPLLLDVRTPAEYADGHIPGAVNLPHDRVIAEPEALAAWKERGVVLYCRSGRRSGEAEEALRSAGFERLWQVEGQHAGWRARGLPEEAGVAAR